MPVQNLPPVPNTPLVADPASDAIWKRWLSTAFTRIVAAMTGPVSVVTANGVSGSVANPTTTPAITLSLGAITPTSVSTGNLTSSSLTAGRVTFAGTAGLLSDNSNMTWNNTTRTFSIGPGNGTQGAFNQILGLDGDPNSGSGFFVNNYPSNKYIGFGQAATYGWLQSFGSVNLALNPIGNRVVVGGGSDNGTDLLQVTGTAGSIYCTSASVPLTTNTTASGTNVKTGLLQRNGNEVMSFRYNTSTNDSSIYFAQTAAKISEVSSTGVFKFDLGFSIPDLAKIADANATNTNYIQMASTAGANNVPSTLFSGFQGSNDGNPCFRFWDQSTNAGNRSFGVGTGGTYADLFVIMQGGQVIVNGASSKTIGNANQLQVQGTTAATNSIGISAWSADALGARLEMGKSRGAAIGTNTIVQNGDVLGGRYDYGANGSGFTLGGSIEAVCSGTPGASNDMPTDYVIKTTPDGSGTPTEGYG